jgi:hypothetical protein
MTGATSDVAFGRKQGSVIPLQDSAVFDGESIWKLADASGLIRINETAYSAGLNEISDIARSGVITRDFVQKCSEFDFLGSKFVMRVKMVSHAIPTHANPSSYACVSNLR